MSKQNRVAAGVRAGGEFTHGRRGAAAGVHLDAHPDAVDDNSWCEGSPTVPATTLPDVAYDQIRAEDAS